MSQELHATREELERRLAWVIESPEDEGTLRTIAVRPAENLRQRLTRCDVSPERGVDGDNWAADCSLKLANGQSDPDVQITMINSRLISLLASGELRQILAGDQLYVDLDLGERNLPAGQRLQIGTAVFEITAEPHTGCRKFSERFGSEALRFINSPEGRQLRLRGVYAKVVTGGSISVGDVIRKA